MTEFEKCSSNEVENDNDAAETGKVIIKRLEIMGCPALSVSTVYGGNSTIFLLQDFLAIRQDGLVSGIILRGGEKLSVCINSEYLVRAFEKFLTGIEGN